MAAEIFIHKMSEHMETAEILEWRVKEGDQVKQFQIIMEVQTDKVTAELEAPASGVVKGIRPGAVNGATVPVGETLGYIASLDEKVPALPPLPGAESAAGAEPAEFPVRAAAQVPGQPAVPQPGALAFGAESLEGAPDGDRDAALAEPTPVRASPIARRVAKDLGVDIDKVTGSGPNGRIGEEDVRAHAQAAAAHRAEPEGPGAVRSSPFVRRLAKELGVDIERVTGTGPNGRVTEEDVRAALAPVQLPAASPVPSPATPVGDEWQDLSPVQRITGERMLASMQTAPQFTLTVTVDMTNALWLREAVSDRFTSEFGARPSITALLVKAVAATLLDQPRANASFVNDRLLLHREINVGVAMGSDAGLVVPVIREADRKSLAEVTQAMQSLQEKLKPMRYGAEDLAGGTFTISNLGMYGIDQFTAIINPPQSAILAVGRVADTPVGMPNGTIALRPMMVMTLTVDHRAMDGITGAEFLARLKERLEKPYFML